MARSEPLWVRKPLAASSISEGEAETGRVGRIEKIEIGGDFVVVTGWAAESDGRPVDGALTIELAGLAYPVAGLLARADLEGQGISAAACAFCIDVPRPAGMHGDDPVRLVADGVVLSATDQEQMRSRSFKAVASFDAVAPDMATGWIFDPGLWHGEVLADQVELTVGRYRLPVEVDVRRFDLPFSAARTGRPLGFQIALAAELRAKYGTAALGELATGPSVRVSLLSQGYHLASATVAFEVATESPAAPAIDVAEEEMTASGEEPDGFLDFHGFSEGLGGWLCGGWIRTESLGDAALTHGRLRCADGSLRGDALFLTYPRPDVEGFGFGILGFLPGAAPRSGELGEIAIGHRPRRVLRKSTTVQELGEMEAVGAVRHVIRGLPDAAATEFGKAVMRPVYEGVDTVNKLNKPIFFEVDEVIMAGGDGVALIGWFLDPTRAVASIRIRSTSGASNPLAERWLKLDRPDIRDAFSGQFGLDRADFGFHAYGALPGLDPKKLYAELTLANGDVAFKPLPAPTRSGRPGIIRVLADVMLTADTVKDACAQVLGPPVVAINRDQVANRRAPAVMAAGALPERPRVSMVVPLYGRLDFMMYQMALMSEHGGSVDELVYVLDQPERKSEFLALARSSYRRYGVPARLVLPPENLGFAGASNAGMDAARGDYVCFLNSDVMPVDGVWMDRLVAAMERDPGIGLLGAQLLFEDDTVQHAGMAMKRLPTFGNMPFPYHPGKGRLPRRGDDVRRVPLVTGALMLMRRDLALKLGGFDTDYVIGDFEDADLCMKVRAEGLDCAVHDGVRLYHLERQSQGSAANAWRQNLTLVNAWTFAQRWEDVLDDLPVAEDLVQLG